MALRLAVLLSGSGTTLQNLLDRSGAGTLDAEVVCVVSSREGVYGLERAQQAKIPAVAVPRKAYANTESFSDDVWRAVDAQHVDLVVLAGFMSLLTIPKAYEGRIINVHPALIPAFCGKGMYGRHVHESVLEKGVKVTGVTVHMVDEEYDHGPIILQGVVPVLEDDSVESLEARVQAEERELYPQAIQLFAQNRLRLEGHRVRILP